LPSSVLDDAALGGATPVEPKSISPTDPAARYTGAANALAVFEPHVKLMDKPNARTGLFRAATSPSIQIATSMSAPAAKS
jgi:hypothetical protein